MGFILGLVLDQQLNTFGVPLTPQNDCFGKYLRAFSSPLNRKSLLQVDTVVIVLVLVLFGVLPFTTSQNEASQTPSLLY